MLFSTSLALVIIAARLFLNFQAIFPTPLAVICMIVLGISSGRCFWRDYPTPFISLLFMYGLTQLHLMMLYAAGTVLATLANTFLCCTLSKNPALWTFYLATGLSAEAVTCLMPKIQYKRQRTNFEKMLCSSRISENRKRALALYIASIRNRGLLDAIAFALVVLLLTGLTYLLSGGNVTVTIWLCTVVSAGWQVDALTSEGTSAGRVRRVLYGITQKELAHSIALPSLLVLLISCTCLLPFISLASRQVDVLSALVMLASGIINILLLANLNVRSVLEHGKLGQRWFVPLIISSVPIAGSLALFGIARFLQSHDELDARRRVR